MLYKTDNYTKIEDARSELGNLTHDSNANILKLPYITSSIPQFICVIKELR